MPAMPRYSVKGTKIAYKILGIPANIAYKPNQKERVVNKRLIFEETARVR
jgi:hypothetical protein